jgi:hypothetical protein
MSSSNGTEYYLKSMNGIKVFDDGSGTVIEDDSITVKTIDCETITTNSFFTDSFNLDVLNTTSITSLTGNLTVNCDLTTTGTTKTNIISSLTGATGTIGLIGDVQATKIKSDYVEVLNNITCLNCSADNTLNCITLDADYVNVSSLGNISTNTIISPSGVLALGPTGQVNIGSQYSFYGSNINGISDGTTTYGIMNNITTANLRIGHSMVSGTIAIGNNKSSGDINIMNNVPSSGSINIGDNLNGTINMCRNSTTGGNINMCNAFKFYKDNIDFTNSSSSFNLFNNISSTTTINMGGTGTTKIGKLTVNTDMTASGTITGNIIKTSKIQPPSLISQIEFYKDSSLPVYFTNFKFLNKTIEALINSDIVELFNNITTGSVLMCNNLVIRSSSIASTAVADTITLFNNLTTGILNVGNGLTTGTLNLGGVGNVKVGNVFTFKSENITSSGVADIINVFNNIQTGTINFCNGLTSGIVNMGGAGTVKINSKFQVGSSNIQGYTSFINTDTGTPSNYTITTPINIELMVNGAGAYTNVLYLPSYISGQKIYVRSTKPATYNILISAQTGQNIVSPSGTVAQTFQVSSNRAVMLGCDGSKWVAFAYY